MGESSGGVWGEVASFLTESVAGVEDVVDARWRSMKRRMGWNGVARVMPYAGYANDSRAWFHGRVLTNPPRDLPGEDDTWWQNLAAMYQRIESDEVPGVDVAIDFGGKRHVVTSDEEGYVRLESAYHRAADHHGLWTAAAMQIVGPSHIKHDSHVATARLMTPPAGAKLGVISDVDDTILQTDVVNLLAMARHTFFGNARTRKPLAGAAALYRALQAGVGGGPPNPIWYVSSSPWNLFDLLVEFLDLNDIPLGPLLLRDFGLEQLASSSDHSHKAERAIEILDAFPNLPFVLIGDSGQQDAELYSGIAEQRGDQIGMILIRDVDPGVASLFDRNVQPSVERAAAAGVPMHLIESSVDAAEHLAAAGFLGEGVIAAIADDAEHEPPA